MQVLKLLKNLEFYFYLKINFKIYILYINIDLNVIYEINCSNKFLKGVFNRCDMYL